MPNLDPSDTTGPISNPIRFQITYKEKWPESPRSEWHDDNAAVVKILDVEWSDWRDAIKDLLGYPLLIKNNGGRFISRYVPDNFTFKATDNGFESPRPFLYATEIREIEGVGVPEDTVCIDQFGDSRFRLARLTVKYETLSFPILFDTEMVSPAINAKDSFGNPDESSLLRYVTITTRPTSTYLNLPFGSYVWAGYSEIVPGTPGKVQPGFDVEIVWHRIPRAGVPLRTFNQKIATTLTSGAAYIDPISDCLGCVNLTDWGGFQKGTLLLVGAEIRPIRSAIGDRLFDIHYKFSHFPAQSKDTQSGAGWTGSTRAAGFNLIFWTNPAGSTSGYFEVVRGAPVVRKGNLTSGSPIAAAIDTTDLAPGMSVTGTGIAAGTVTTAIGGDQVTLSANATGTAAGVSLSFYGSTTSNARRDVPVDGLNPFNHREFRDLFRVPQLQQDQ